MNLSQVEEIVCRHREAGEFPMAAVRVFSQDATLLERYYGDVDANTWFDMASVSKLFTTTMLLLLQEEGRLSPQDLVLQHLPENGPGPVTRARLQGVTLYRLLTHTSGLLPWFPFYADGRPFYTVLERALTDSPVQQGMVYSDLNFMLLAEVFKTVSGLTLREGLARYIQGELGIRDVCYGPMDSARACPTCYGSQIEEKMCADRGLSFDGWRPHGVAVAGSCNDGNAHYYFGGASGHAGIFATPGAMEQLGRFLLTTGRPAFVAAMQTLEQGRGLGFDRSDPYLEGCGHSGFTGTSLWVSREHGVGAVLLTNRLYRTDGAAPLLTACRRELHQALLA